MRVLEWLRHITGANERQVVFGLLVLGVVARLKWVLQPANLKPLINESHNIAVSLARTGHFNDPFLVATGPTAHIGMLTPLPAAAAYAVLGVDTPAAEFALSLWALTIVTGGFWICWRLAIELGIPKIARLGLITFIALAPLQFGLEMREGRTWEVNLAVTLLLLILLRLLADPRTARACATNGALTGLLAIISPPAGLAALMPLLAHTYFRRKHTAGWISLATFAVVFVAMAGFWAQRNLQVMGKAIPLRDNFGLELAISNYSGALNATDQHSEYLRRIAAIHPMGKGLAAMSKAGGEVAYYGKLGTATRTWIYDHPLEFIRLSLRRASQFYLPPQWFWHTFGAPSSFIPIRQALSWLADIVGLASLGFLGLRSRPHLYLLLAASCCAFPYILVQPILRYRYLISTLLVLAAVDGVARLLRYTSDHSIAAEIGGEPQEETALLNS